MKQKWVCLAALYASCAVAASAQEARFLTFDEARETLSAFGRTDDAAAWDAWIRTQDRDVRARVDRGVEDSIGNLILYGTSFTGLPPLAIESAVTSAGGLTEAARARVRALAAAAAGPETNERLRFAREFLARRGIQPKDTETFLAANLARFAIEQREYQEKLRLAAASGDPQETLLARATLYDRRGLSVDTALLPNFALEDTLAAMLRKVRMRRRRVNSF